MQETFAIALAQQADYDPARGSVGSWLTVLSRNVIRDHLRAHTARRRARSDVGAHRRDARADVRRDGRAAAAGRGARARRDARPRPHGGREPARAVPQRAHAQVRRRREPRDARERARHLRRRHQISSRPRPPRVPRHVRDAVGAASRRLYDDKHDVLETERRDAARVGGEPPRIDDARARAHSCGAACSRFGERAGARASHVRAIALGLAATALAIVACW